MGRGKGYTVYPGTISKRGNLKYKLAKIAEETDFNKLVEETYKKPYNLQQYGGFEYSDPLSNDSSFVFSVPPIYGGVTEDRQKAFEEWLEREASEDSLSHEICRDWDNHSERYTKAKQERMAFERDWAPPIDALVNDMVKRGVLEEGTYTLEVGW